MRNLSAAVLLAAGLTVASASVGAFAADGPSARIYKAPEKASAVTPDPSWAGFYAGVNLGAAWGKSDNSWSAVADPAGFTAAGAAALNAAGAGSISTAGLTAGGQVGVNYQVQRFVFGVEADFDYTNLRGTRTPPVGPPFVAGSTIIQTFESNWLATVRPRIGYAINSLLVYGTGGLAIANVGVTDHLASLPPDALSSSSGVRTGWTAGGGIEWKYASHWSAKLEYLHVDLGSLTDSAAIPGLPTTLTSHDHRFSEDIVRTGVSYLF